VGIKIIQRNKLHEQIWYIKLPTNTGGMQTCDMLTWLESGLVMTEGAGEGVVLLSAEAGSMVALSIHEL
jgi:hypothetical protein